MTKRFILDYLGTALAGVPEESSETAVKSLMELPGEKQDCTVIGQTQKKSCLTAALINGILGHTVEMDDDHREAIMHPGAVVIPAALAVAESESKSGKHLIEAVLAGYEIAIRVGAGLLGKAMFTGWHPTGTCGVFGAAIAAAKLMDLDEEGLTNTLNIAGSLSSGLFEFKADGSWTKRFHAGKAAISGIIAAELAKEGFACPTKLLESETGFFQAYSNRGIYKLELVDNKLGEKYMAFDTSVKPYACGRFSQPVIDCALDLTNRYDLKPQDIKDVLVKTDSWTAKAYGTPKEKVYHPKTTVDAQFSIPYAAAVAIVRRKARLNEFSPEAIKDPVILEVASKVRYEVDPEIEAKYPLYYPCAMTIWTNDGRKLDTYIDFPKGDPENPVTDEELVEKFEDIASRAIFQPQRINQLINTIWEIDKLPDIHELTRLL
jgi:2-methylcitrate dehydratase PrpD